MAKSKKQILIKVKIMTTEISKSLTCIVVRNGIEIWVEAAKAEKFQADLISGMKGFCQFDGQLINTADVIGVFRADTMADYTRRKNGQWKCAEGNWHDKGIKCECPKLSEVALWEKRQEAIKNCGKCKNGFITEGNTSRYCECQKEFIEVQG